MSAGEMVKSRPRRRSSSARRGDWEASTIGGIMRGSMTRWPRRRWLAGSSLENEGDGTVVDESDLHHRPEPSRRYATGTGAEGLDESLIKRLRDFGRSGLDEAGPPPLASITAEGELRNDEKLAADLFDRPIHAALVIG